MGLHQNKLRRYADRGKVPCIRTESGQRRYGVDGYLREVQPVRTVCYCRVSSFKHRDDLRRQVAWMLERYPAAEVIQDIGGGLNWRRRGLVSLLERLHRGDKLQIVVAPRDRLARLGFEVLQRLAEANGGEVVVLGNADYSPERELTEDILAILHTFSCRLHGLRRYGMAVQADQDIPDGGAEGDAAAVV